MSNVYDVSFGRISPIVDKLRIDTYCTATEKICGFLRESGVEFEKFTTCSPVSHIVDIVVYPKNEIENNFIYASISIAKLLAESCNYYQSSQGEERYYCFDNILNTHYSLNIIIDFTHFNKSI